MALLEPRGIYFPLGAAFLGSMVQSRLDMKNSTVVEGLVHPPTAFTSFLISSLNLQLPVVSTLKHTRLPLFF